VRALLSLLFWLSSTAIAGTYTEAVHRLEFDLLAQTFTEEKVVRLLGGHLSQLPEEERRAAAVLISLGALELDDLETPDRVEKLLGLFERVVADRHPALLGRIGDVSLLPKLATPRNYNELLAADELTTALGEELSKGVITGYDLRMKGVYDGFPAGHFFIYSHSSLLHLRQLVTLLHSEDIDGWIYLTPKVSAFLYREDWGPVSSAVATLAGGVRVVQGQEFAVMFLFDAEEDRKRFHELIVRYAKKDSNEEPGLIAGSWWQPFYYTDRELAGFKAISLVVIASAKYEATLTVVEEKTQAVVEALAEKPWPLRVEKVWVNPPFFRFLNGDYK